MTTPAQAWAEAAEQRLLDEALRLAPVHGWTRRTVGLAGKALGMSEGETGLLLPHGPADLAALLSRRHDARALAALADVHPSNLKIRERIRRAVEARLDAAAPDEPALRRWMGFLALPQNLSLGSRLAWESADVLWRWAGDTATDENHYTKRAILAGILSTAGAIRSASGRKEALAFVDRRIEDVMRFESWKATTGLRPGAWMGGLAERLARARYGA
ncbi:COQ9 family protein [Phenylobacterium sp. SCN 70-31]|uniref:COQ9 family protein n=1 Tax=Phenylobacterium sp. SCN 70-31 TaxID=1660129 RepID=UPI00086D224A|nr:COQ9 family protein [Phenylobacterium sp. SCN 70-31]ODT89214.1 MAG: rpsU-divergently transcribed protein [Phenylobacterium sp. SCN 70-31]